jgi:formylglycine-generating enzyme required for sulfatase activity
VVRGGYWGDNPNNLRSAWRHNGEPATRGTHVGFRLGLTP